MILVLQAAAVVSGLLGEWVDTLVIVVIVVLNAVIGFSELLAGMHTTPEQARHIDSIRTLASKRVRSQADPFGRKLVAQLEGDLRQLMES